MNQYHVIPVAAAVFWTLLFTVWLAYDIMYNRVRMPGDPR